MNHVGTNDAIATAHQQHVALAAAQPPYPNPVAITSGYREYQGETTLITAPTYRDRLYGQGMGVQRHPGNVIFRALVFANQVRQYLPAVLHTRLSSKRSCPVVGMYLPSFANTFTHYPFCLLDNQIRALMTHDTGYLCHCSHVR
jgi:hypothetical protein